MLKSIPMPAHAKRVFKGIIFDVWQWEQQMYDGSTQIFERLRRPNVTSVIATVGDKILLQEQQQPDYEASFLCVPGGHADEGEEALSCAKRELLEETGYESGEWSLLWEEHPQGKIEWTISTFIARNCRKIKEPELDPGEKIVMREITFDEFLMLSEDSNFDGPRIKTALLRARFIPEERDALHAAIFGA